MKIAILRRQWVSHGGGERFAERYVEELGQAGHEAHVFCERWTPAPGPAVVERMPRIPGSRALATLAYALLAPRRARARGLDLVHSFERTLSQDVFRAGEGCHRQWLALRERERPWKALDRARLLHRVLLAIERRICQRGGARAVIVNSGMVAQDFQRLYRPLRAPLILIRNAVDLERFHPARRARARDGARRSLGLDPHAPLLLTVGSGFERKGVESIIAAIGQLRRRTALAPVLLVAGKGNASRLVQRAAGGGLAGQVRFLGVVDDPWPLYAAADAFVLPSIYDPASNATLEALAMGLPVVTTLRNGSAELIKPGVSGWVLNDTADPIALADAVREAIERRSDTALTEAARDAVAAWGWPRHLAENLALYASLREVQRGSTARV